MPTVNPDQCWDAGDTTWVLISSVLVLGMMPALAFFEAGMLRSKNTLSLMTQIFSGVMTLSVLWMVIGYTLTFGPTAGGFIGNMDNFLWLDVSYFECNEHAPTIPSACFALFEMMFAAITPLLMTGSFAERMRWKHSFLFIILWEITVYYPVAHWIWGGGFLGKWGTLDFAGGIVIHTTAGVGSIVCALMLGRRQQFERFMGEFPPSNLPLAATGAALLWMGWFGFNGGSALQAGPVAVSALISTQIGCAAGSFAWMVLAWWSGKPSLSGMLNGALAGLAGITPASGYINTQWSLLLGLIFGVASFYGVHLAKHKWHLDDALDVNMVHGLTGVIGSLAVGLFASEDHSGIPGANGAFYGHGMQFVYQLCGVLLAAAWAGFWTWLIIVFLTRIYGPLRVNDREEEIGLDWIEHGEIAYHKLHVLNKKTPVGINAAQSHLLSSASASAGNSHVGDDNTLHSSLLDHAHNGHPVRSGHRDSLPDNDAYKLAAGHDHGAAHAHAHVPAVLHAASPLTHTPSGHTASASAVAAAPMAATAASGGLHVAAHES